MLTAYAMAYLDPRWTQLVLIIKRMFGFKCAQCRRKRKDGAILQVHHLEYFAGRAPWDYPPSNFIVLCDLCHYAQHHPVRVPPRTQLPLFTREELGTLFRQPIQE